MARVDSAAARRRQRRLRQFFRHERLLWPFPSPSTTPHEVRRWQGPGERGTRSTRRHDDRSHLLPRRSSGCTTRRTPKGVCGRVRSQTLSRRRGSSGTPWSTLSTPCASLPWCTCSMHLCRRWWNSFRTSCISSTCSYLFPSRLSKCPRSVEQIVDFPVPGGGLQGFRPGQSSSSSSSSPAGVHGYADEPVVGVLALYQI